MATRHNLYILTTAGWNLGPTPDVAGVFNDTIVDAANLFTGNCKGFLNATKAGVKLGIYTGDWNLAVTNSTPVLPSPSPPPAPPSPSSPAWPPLGHCSPAVAAWSLAEEPGARLVGKTDTAPACALLCKGRCTGYTWHDKTCAGFQNDCYATFEPHAWQNGRHIDAGHHSGICNNGGGHPNALSLAELSALGTGADLSHFFCGGSLAEWQHDTKGQDMHTRTCSNTDGECSSEIWIKLAREMLWAGQ